MAYRPIRWYGVRPVLCEHGQGQPSPVSLVARDVGSQGFKLKPCHLPIVSKTREVGLIYMNSEDHELELLLATLESIAQL